MVGTSEQAQGGVYMNRRWTDLEGGAKDAELDEGHVGVMRGGGMGRVQSVDRVSVAGLDERERWRREERYRRRWRGSLRLSVAGSVAGTASVALVLVSDPPSGTLLT